MNTTVPLDYLLIGVLVLVAFSLVMQLVLLFRKTRIDLTPILHILQAVEQSYERAERSVREEISKNRQEITDSFKQLREEVAGALKGVGDSLYQQVGTLTQTTDQKLERVREIVDERLRLILDESAKKLYQMRQEGSDSAKQMREETSASLKSFNDSVLNTMTGISELQKKEMANFSAQLGKLTESNEQKLDSLRKAVEEKLKAIQEDNAKQLDQMRMTVDQKLEGTLEKRLGESFKQVSERLEQVYKGLGEMQALASGVGDLKKVLTNVKARGIWGEVQLGAMLEQVLNPDQYAANVSTKDGGERVEFAIKLPGRSETESDVVWLPIDAKFPIEDYQRLIEAQEKGDASSAEDAARQLEFRIKQCAGDIYKKYLNPPKTTDFAILFLPIEGLFAEIIRLSGLPESIQRDYRVMIAGPTTLWAILNSLQMGFRTLAIQKRSSEVWNLLAAVKTEWSRYGEVLEKVQKKLHEASSTIEKAQTRTRAIGRKLREVEELPMPEAQAVLMVDNDRDLSGEEIEGA